MILLGASNSYCCVTAVGSADVFGLSKEAEGWLNFGIGFVLVLIVVAALLYWHRRSGGRW